MNVLVVEPGMEPYEKEINGLKEMQTTVGGLITVSYPFKEPVAIVSNDSSIGMGLPFNRSIEGGYGGIFGTFFVCALSTANKDENQGYIIEKSVLFNNNRGFALGKHPREGFVTWQFTEEQGRRDYYWGHYHSDETAAERDYLDRTTDYQRRYEVHEIESSSFYSLTPEQMEHFKKKYHQAEILVAVKDNTPITLKVEPRPYAQPDQPKRPPKKPGR